MSRFIFLDLVNNKFFLTWIVFLKNLLISLFHQLQVSARGKKNHKNVIFWVCCWMHRTENTTEVVTEKLHLVHNSISKHWHNHQIIIQHLIQSLVSLVVVSSLFSLRSRGSLGGVLQPVGRRSPVLRWGTVRPADGNLLLQPVPAAILPILLQQPLQLPAVPGDWQHPVYLYIFTSPPLPSTTTKYQINVSVMKYSCGNCWFWSRLLPGWMFASERDG